MARSIEEILKEQLGNLLLQLSILQSKVEELQEDNARLKAYQEGAKEEKKVEEPNV